jgi:hypothetical protein
MKLKYKTTFNSLQWRLMLYKRYFDYGFGMTNYFKYFVYLFAASELFISQNIKFSIIILLAWGISSFFIGWALYRYGWYAAEIEVSNRANPFVKDVRRKI